MDVHSMQIIHVFLPVIVKPLQLLKDDYTRLERRGTVLPINSFLGLIGKCFMFHGGGVLCCIYAKEGEFCIF